MRMTLKSTTDAKISKTQMESPVLAKTRRMLKAAALMAVGFCGQASADAIDVGRTVQALDIQIEHSTVVVKRQSDGQTWVSNPERVTQRFSPASSSKIPHTLIALESGLATPATVFVWDGVPRASRAWNQDHTLASAFKYSAVWVYQEIARTAGQQVMSEGLARFAYGNTNVRSIDHLTTYWLDDTLKISAVEQVEFLSRLALEQLPLSDATYAAAKDIMVSDKGANWVMRSKTGWRYSKETMDIGWYVGWLECSDETYVFAVNLDMPDTRYLSKRKEIMYSILQDIGAFDCA